MGEESKNNISFNEFELDTAHRQLLRDGEIVPLYAKTFDLLEFLANNSGRILTKDEILEAVWEGQFVEEANLSVQISALRKALGEATTAPRFLVTVPGKGYKFVADVAEQNTNEESFTETAEDLQHLQDTSADERPTDFRLPPKKSTSTKYTYLLVAAAILLIGSAALFFTDFGKSLWQKKSAPIPQSNQRLISTFSGSHTQASFSPDGKRIAFVNHLNETPQIWIKDLEGGEPVRLTAEDEFAEHPRWSPVGDEIIYLHKGADNAGIYQISIDNKNSRKIIDGGRNPNWSRDGKKIVFEREYDIWTANKDGSDQRRVEGVPPTDLLWADRMPAFSPDGTLIAYFQNDKGPMGDYWTIPAAGGEAKRLTNDATFGGAAVFMPDGESIIFPSRRGGSMTLWRVSIKGGEEPEPVLNSAGEDFEPQISFDAGKLIYTNTRKTYTLMLTDAKSGESREVKDSRLEMVFPDFSPDGKRIAFFGFNEKGEIHIFTIGTDGKDLKQMTDGKGEMNLHPQWSDDGQTIYFYQIKPTVSFRKISVSGGSESVELVKDWEWGTQNHAQVSPDGRRIIYTKLDRGKPVATMIRNIETGNETAFTLTLRQMRWSSDGKFIAGADLSGGGWGKSEVAICPTDGNPCRKIAKGYRPFWSADDSQIFYHSEGTSEGESVWLISADGGEGKKITDLQPMESIGHFYAVSATGEIAWVKFEQSKSELWMANFSSH